MTVHEDTNSHSHDRLCDVKQIQQTNDPRYSLLQLYDNCRPCKRIKKEKLVDLYVLMTRVCCSVQSLSSDFATHLGGECRPVEVHRRPTHCFYTTRTLFCSMQNDWNQIIDYHISVWASTLSRKFSKGVQHVPWGDHLADVTPWEVESYADDNLTLASDVSQETWDFQRPSLDGPIILRANSRGLKIPGHLGDKIFHGGT
jgi:hypothetical protein